MSALYAKSNPVKTIAEHTTEVISVFKELIASKPVPIDEVYYEYIQKLLWYHDAGKVSIPFQNYIRRLLKMVPLVKSTLEYYPHEWLSPSFITKEDRKFFQSYNCDENDIDFLNLARYCIAYHHNRNFSPDRKEILRQLKEIETNKELLETSELNPVSNIDEIRNIIESLEYWPEYFKYVAIFKGILHKCDYAASANIKAEQQFFGNYQQLFKERLTFPVDDLKQQQVNAKELSDKSIIFVASTGAGKTEYSMNWINGDKAFYLLGLRTAVDAMYNRFKKMFAFDKKHKDNVALLHGESIYRLLDEAEYTYDKESVNDIFQQYTKIRQLSAPITVATADQLVPSVFKFPGFEFFYFTASYSKIIIDEIQSFSPAAIASIVVFLIEIYKLGAKFLLMTATLPPFVKNDLKSMLGEKAFVEDEYLSAERRHVIEIIDKPLNAETIEVLISNALQENKKVLVISNTVAGAQRLYRQLQEYSPDLLHARFIKEDRSKKESEIIALTQDNTKAGTGPALWISTQIVEASLDIDFDVLITEHASIEALFQRFGRCYRKRIYEKKEPNIYIFRPEDTRSTALIYDQHLLAATWEVLSRFSGKAVTEEDKQNIINEVFSDVETTDYYTEYKKIKDLLTLGLRATKSEAHNYFRNITNNYLTIPQDVYERNKSEIDGYFIKTQDMELSKEERFDAKSGLRNFTVPVQLFGKKQGLLAPIYVDETSLTKCFDIWLLKGVEYTYERGAEFIEGYLVDKAEIL